MWWKLGKEIFCTTCTCFCWIDGHKRARNSTRRHAHSFYWASGWAGCWKAGHSIAVSRLHNVPLKCVQICNWGCISVPEPESQRDGSDSTAGALIPFSKAKVILGLFCTKSFPDIFRYTYTCQTHVHFRCCFYSYFLCRIRGLFLVEAETIWWDGAVQSLSSNDSP